VSRDLAPAPAPVRAPAPPAPPTTAPSHPQHRRRSDLQRSLGLFRRYLGGRRVFVLALLMLVAEAATAVIEPYPLAYLIDFLQGTRPDLRSIGLPAFLSSPLYETVVVLTGGILVIAMVNSAADSLAEIYFARGGRNLGYNLRVALYGHLQKLSLTFHDQRRTGDVLTRVTGDVTVLEEFILKSASDLAGSVLVLVGSLAFLLSQSWQVALVAMLIVPLLAAVSNHYSRLIKAASKRQRAREGELASGAQEMLTSIRVVQTYGQSGYDERRFARQSAASMQASLEAATVEARFSWVVAVLEALAISAVVWVGVLLIDRSALTVGTLILFILVTQNMFKPTRKIIKEWYTIGKVYASVERIADLLDRRPDVQDAPDAVPAPPLRGAIEFQHVSFSYRIDGAPAREALQDVSFAVEPGGTLALVGYSGGGKSTIAQLLPRLYDPDVGRVLVDGEDLRRYTLASLRSQISLVLQDTVLFTGTVADNIAYGLTDVSREDIVAAAQLANAHEFISQLPAGYDTELGERGANLSGGQRQRIAIARAFVRNPPVLVLDEPTTGLDVESSQLVLQALDTLMLGKTTIVISHDLGLIRRSDRICVVDGGRIVESGSHDELLAADGLYAELYARHLGADDVPSSPPIDPSWDGRG
jgi:ABC-type multidrug transport system fused ATPase/permease subunit